MVVSVLGVDSRKTDAHQMDTHANDLAFEVLDRALQAFDFLSRGEPVLAAAVWKALPNAQALADCGDALVVASANAGLAKYLLQDVSSARAALMDAARVLSSAREAESKRVRATSSSYHFRLATRHGDTFARATTARCTELRKLMSSVVAHHVALMESEAREPIEQEAMRAAVEAAFGQASVEARLCRAVTQAEISECYAARANKLRTLRRHWRSTSQLSPEFSVAALAIWPCRLSSASDCSGATTAGEQKEVI